MNLKETDACPSCWHKHDHSVGGIGTFPIHNIIGHKGGVLNEFKTCSVCNWNWVQVQHCKKCKISFSLKIAKSFTVQSFT